VVSDQNRRVHRTVARQRFRSRPDDRQEPQRYQTAGTWAVRYEHRLHGAPVSLPRTASPSSFCHRQRLRSPNPVWHVLTQRPGSGESLRKRFCIVRCRANGQRREKTQPAHYRKTRRVDHPRSQLRHRSKQGQHQRHANQAQGYRAFKQRLGPPEPHHPTIAPRRHPVNRPVAQQATESGSWIAASSRRAPPQSGHVKNSTRNTRRNSLGRASLNDLSSPRGSTGSVRAAASTASIEPRADAG